MEAKKKTTIAELNKLYLDAEAADKSLFAEQRSNILLASGDHYSKKHSRHWASIRSNEQLNDEVKLRITKNHIHRICSIYVNNIFAVAPGVAILPKNERELHDQKVAEMHDAVWKDLKDRHCLREKVRALIEDFVKIGEMAWKIFWDPQAGKFLGYKPAVDEATGEVVLDEMGQPVASEEPVFSGDIVFEQIHGFNLLRHPNSKNFYDGCVIYRKMMDIATLKAVYANNEEKLGFIQPSAHDEFKVFDGATGNYHDTKEQLMLREYYYPVSTDYPEGYYYITTEHGILEEGKLPFSIFPIVFDGFDSIPTTPRKRSIIKQLRPVQAELNRAASAMATQQVTLGDDKLLIQSGTSITSSSKLPGVRAINYAGAPPTVLAGRTGEQYLGYVAAQQQELYVIANMPEELEEKPVGQVDPMAELYKAIRNKKKYSMYGEKVESFLKKSCMTALQLAKMYYTDEQLIAAIGKQEIVNLPEFRSEQNLGYEIRLEPQSDDVETKMGKQISLTNIIQYVGSQLGKEDIGKIIRVMPFVNKEEIFSDFTTDYDCAVNDILALDRGEVPSLNVWDDHKYLIKKLEHRRKQPDFKFLHPQIQQNYENFIHLHEQAEVEQLNLIKKAQSELIPTDGYLVTVDLYVTDPQNPGKTRRARVPYAAMNWLIQQLEKQGVVMSELERLQQSAVSDMASQFINQGLVHESGLPNTERDASMTSVV